MLRNLKHHSFKASAGLGLLLASALSHAVAIVDYTSAATTATTELTATIATALPIFGTIMAVSVGIRMVKKFFRG